MDKALRLIDVLSRFAETVAVILIFGYCGLMLLEVVARSQANSLSYSWEYSQYAMAAIFALAAGPAIRTGVHVRITLLREQLPKPMARWLDIIATAAAVLIVSFIVFALWHKVGKSIDRNIVATTVSKTPLWIPQALVLWGFAQLWLDCFARLARLVKNVPCEWRLADAEPTEAVMGDD